MHEKVAYWPGSNCKSDPAIAPKGSCDRLWPCTAIPRSEKAGGSRRGSARRCPANNQHPVSVAGQSGHASASGNYFRCRSTTLLAHREAIGSRPARPGRVLLTNGIERLYFLFLGCSETRSFGGESDMRYVSTRARSVRHPVDFKRITLAALPVLPSILARWLPSGRREGAEYLALNPRRNDRHPGSFKVNLRTGHWADFAVRGASGRDVVSLAAHLADISQTDAAWRYLQLGWPLSPVNPRTRAPLIDGGFYVRPPTRRRLRTGCNAGRARCLPHRPAGPTGTLQLTSKLSIRRSAALIRWPSLVGQFCRTRRWRTRHPADCICISTRAIAKYRPREARLAPATTCAAKSATYSCAGPGMRTFAFAAGGAIATAVNGCGRRNIGRRHRRARSAMRRSSPSGRCLSSSPFS